MSPFSGLQANDFGLITSFWAADISPNPYFPCIVRPKDTEQLSINKGNICIVLKTESFYMVTNTIHKH